MAIHISSFACFLVAIIANWFFFGISKYVISKRFTINLYFIYLAKVLYV